MTDKEAEDVLTKHVEGLKANPYVIVDDCLYKAFNIALKALNVMRRMKEAYLADVSKTPLDIDNVQDYRESDFNVKEWLSSFNTESATVCFTEVQELKKRLEV